MSDHTAFHQLMAKVRAGDAAAAAELIRQYEPEIRRVVRLRLTDPGLYRLLDSMDICQSVLANFFVRVSAGQFELEQPEQLLRLLVSMARNRLLDHVRRQRAGRRDQRRVEARSPEALAALPGRDETPSQIVAARDLLREFQARLSERERELAAHRARGLDWAEIAAAVGGRPDAVRKQLARAVQRVARQLNLDEANIL